MVQDLTQEEIKKLFRYQDGYLYWRNRSQRININNPISSKVDGRYATVKAKGHHRYAHRIIWILHNGPIPDGLDIDHINRIKTDNSIENLRVVTKSQNGHNAGVSLSNTSGVTGVIWRECRETWEVKITVNREVRYLGVSRDFFKACCLRKSAELKVYKEIGLV